MDSLLPSAPRGSGRSLSPSWCSRSRQAWPARICPVKIFAHDGKIFAASLPGVAEERDGAGVAAEVGAHRGEDDEQRGLVSRAQAQGRLRACHGDDDDTNDDDMMILMMMI